MSFLLFSSGCASLSDYHYELTQKKRALAQYKQCNGASCSHYPHDYKKGWLDGFYEVATGGPCCPPAIAPECYWEPGQILDNCDNRRHAYYSGWQDGASRATQFPDTHFLRIHETCECPFPRCECPSCSSCNKDGQCSTESCQTCSLDGGMVYDANVIETDSDILMMPIPDPSEALPVASPPQEASEPSVEELPAASTTEELMPPAPKKKDADTTAPKVDDAAAASPGTLDIEVSTPRVIEPPSSSDELPPSAELRQRPTIIDSISTPMKQDEDRTVLPKFTYNFGSDNSQTIDFQSSSHRDFVDAAEITALSDFDIRLDGVGMIE